MAVITWKSGEVPANLKVTQVYGILFTEDGRILLRIENGKYKLAGGKPELFDTGMEGTLKRELLEEINVTINKAYIVGYQLVDEEDETEPYAQVRMTAKIKTIGKVRADPDTGHSYGRFLTHPQKAAQLLNWGQVGINQIEDAVCIAKTCLDITSFSKEDTLISSEST